MMTEYIKIEKIEDFHTKSKIKLSNDQVYFLPIEIVVNHKLVANIVLTESQVELIEFEASLFEALSKAKQYLAMRDHSYGELKIKLKKKKFPDDIISQTLSKCKKLGFLDDEKYAYKLSEKLVENKPCGKAFLMSYLQSKMIPRNLCENIATMIFSSLDIQKQAVLALEKKWYMYNQLELEESRNKSYNYLARRGFSFGEAKDAFEIVYNMKQEDLNN